MSRLQAPGFARIRAPGIRPSHASNAVVTPTAPSDSGASSVADSLSKPLDVKRPQTGFIRPPGPGSHLKTGSMSKGLFSDAKTCDAASLASLEPSSDSSSQAGSIEAEVNKKSIGMLKRPSGSLVRPGLASSKPNTQHGQSPYDRECIGVAQRPYVGKKRGTGVLKAPDQGYGKPTVGELATPLAGLDSTFTAGKASPDHLPDQNHSAESKSQTKQLGLAPPRKYLGSNATSRISSSSSIPSATASVSSEEICKSSGIAVTESGHTGIEPFKRPSGLLPMRKKVTARSTKDTLCKSNESLDKEGSVNANPDNGRDDSTSIKGKANIQKPNSRPQSALPRGATAGSSMILPGPRSGASSEPLRRSLSRSLQNVSGARSCGTSKSNSQENLSKGVSESGGNIENRRASSGIVKPVSYSGHASQKRSFSNSSLLRINSKQSVDFSTSIVTPSDAQLKSTPRHSTSVASTEFNVSPIVSEINHKDAGKLESFASLVDESRQEHMPRLSLAFADSETHLKSPTVQSCSESFAELIPPEAESTFIQNEGMPQCMFGSPCETEPTSCALTTAVGSKSRALDAASPNASEFDAQLFSPQRVEFGDAMLKLIAQVPSESFRNDMQKLVSEMMLSCNSENFQESASAVIEFVEKEFPNFFQTLKGSENISLTDEIVQKMHILNLRSPNVPRGDKRSINTSSSACTSPEGDGTYSDVEEPQSAISDTFIGQLGGLNLNSTYVAQPVKDANATFVKMQDPTCVELTANRDLACDDHSVVLPGVPLVQGDRQKGLLCDSSEDESGVFDVEGSGSRDGPNVPSDVCKSNCSKSKSLMEELNELKDLGVEVIDDSYDVITELDIHESSYSRDPGPEKPSDDCHTVPTTGSKSSRSKSSGLNDVCSPSIDEHCKEPEESKASPRPRSSTIGSEIGEYKSGTPPVPIPLSSRPASDSIQALKEGAAGDDNVFPLADFGESLDFELGTRSHTYSAGMYGSARRKLKRRGTFMSSEYSIKFRPPHLTSFLEMDDGNLAMDHATYCHISNEVKMLKTMLLKLRRALQDSNVQSPLVATPVSMRKAASLRSRSDLPSPTMPFVFNPRGAASESPVFPAPDMGLDPTKIFPDGINKTDEEKISEGKGEEAIAYLKCRVEELEHELEEQGKADDCHKYTIKLLQTQLENYESRQQEVLEENIMLLEENKQLREMFRSGDPALVVEDTMLAATPTGDFSIKEKFTRFNDSESLSANARRELLQRFYSQKQTTDGDKAS